MSNELDVKPEIGEFSASNTAQKPKKVPGRPFTKETAKQAAINAGRPTGRGGTMEKKMKVNKNAKMADEEIKDTAALVMEGLVKIISMAKNSSKSKTE